MQRLDELLSRGGGFNYKLPGGMVFAPSYVQAGLIVFLIFLLILTLGQLRKRFIGWHVSGIMPGVLFGFVIALIIEGLFIIGGRSVITELLGWENAPKPIANVLDAGRGRLVRVLGVSDGENKEEIVGGYERLDEAEQKAVRAIICGGE